MRLPHYKRYIQYINQTPYLVHAVYPIISVKDAKMVKDWLGVDTAFKDNRSGNYIFCDQIQDVSWEEI